MLAKGLPRLNKTPIPIPIPIPKQDIVGYVIKRMTQVRQALFCGYNVVNVTYGCMHPAARLAQTVMSLSVKTVFNWLIANFLFV